MICLRIKNVIKIKMIEGGMIRMVIKILFEIKSRNKLKY